MIAAIATFAGILLWPSVASQLWASRQISRRRFELKDWPPIWLLVSYVAGMAVAFICSASFYPEFGGFLLVAFFVAFAVNVSALDYAKKRIDRAGRNALDNDRQIAAVMR